MQAEFETKQIEIDSALSEDVKDLLKNLLKIDVNKRLTAQQAIDHVAVQKNLQMFQQPLSNDDVKILIRNYIINTLDNDTKVMPDIILEFLRSNDIIVAEEGKEEQGLNFQNEFFDDIELDDSQKNLLDSRVNFFSIADKTRTTKSNITSNDKGFEKDTVIETVNPVHVASIEFTDTQTNMNEETMKTDIDDTIVINVNDGQEDFAISPSKVSFSEMKVEEESVIKNKDKSIDREDAMCDHSMFIVASNLKESESSEVHRENQIDDKKEEQQNGSFDASFEKMENYTVSEKEIEVEKKDEIKMQPNGYKDDLIKGDSEGSKVIRDESHKKIERNTKPEIKLYGSKGDSKARPGTNSNIKFLNSLNLSKDNNEIEKISKQIDNSPEIIKPNENCGWNVDNTNEKSALQQEFSKPSPEIKSQPLLPVVSPNIKASPATQTRKHNVSFEPESFFPQCNTLNTNEDAFPSYKYVVSNGQVTKVRRDYSQPYRVYSKSPMIEPRAEVGDKGRYKEDKYGFKNFVFNQPALRTSVNLTPPTKDNTINYRAISNVGNAKVYYAPTVMNSQRYHRGISPTYIKK